MVRRGPFSYETGHRAAGELLDAPDRPTAIFCGNDTIALGAVNAAAARGIKPGGDLTIIGFDDLPVASWEVFQLTTMRCDLRRMAETAIRLLTARIRTRAYRTNA
jgi:LacI family transcriptional regulator